jgi:fimbrial isopeptide formation D2 family protein/LPXTG-motif cell wall-anchored protein
MKLTNKLAGILLALAMVLGIAATAFAEGETGSITIYDAAVGQTYTIYQILDLESYNNEARAYAYKATTAWNTFINSVAIKGIYVEVDAQGYVTWKGNADAAAFAKLAQKYAKDNSIANQGSVTATTTTVSFNGLDLGYYLVDTTLGTLCSLDTTNPNVVMEEKNEVPTNVKTVEEDSTGAWGATNDADIGQVVNFKSTITAQPGAENYVFHDKMSEGLTYTGDAKIYTDEAMTQELAAGNYMVNANPTDSDTFDITFTQDYLNTITAATKLYVKYSATLNENANVGNDGNPNESKLSYGEINQETGKPGSTTPPSETKTYTWDVDVFKYTMNGETEKALAGATFTLSKNDDGSNPIALVSEGNNVYRVAKTNETVTVTEITTDATGKFTIKGLDADTYYLTETAAPAGYNKLAAPVTIVIGENGVVNGTTEAPQGVDEVKVLNQSGTELPSTGGIGTTIFYIVGGVLVVGAVVLLVTKKRMNNVER